MYKHIVHFKCSCKEESFIDLFNYLNLLLSKGNPENCPSYSSLHTTYWIPGDICQSNHISKRDRQIIASQVQNFIPIAHSHRIRLSQALILVSVDIPWNDKPQDIFSYRYLLLTIRQLLRDQDFAVICCDQEYYNRIGSYLILETLCSKKLFAKVSDKNRNSQLLPFPQKITLSPEWFPAICLGPDSSDIYEVLNNPLFESEDALYQALVAHREDQTQNRIDFQYELKTRSKDESTNSKNMYRIYFQCCFERWLNGLLSGFPLVRQLRHVSAMAQLLFATMSKNLYGNQKQCNNVAAVCKLEDLLEACCDVSDCILQVTENIVSHTSGGVLSIRINDKWKKAENPFIAENMRDSIDKYLRISLVDFSNCDILTSIKKKVHIDGLTLDHVFGAPKSNNDDSARRYQDFLDSEEHVIHHYGLSVFSNVVEQYQGCFAVRSGMSETFTESQRYIQNSPRIRYNRDFNIFKQIPGTEYDILLVLEESIFEIKNIQCNPSLHVSPHYITESPKHHYIFKNDLALFFNENLSSLIRTSSGKFSYQQLKEHVVKNAAMALSNQLIANYSENGVFYFFLSNIVEQVFGRIEIVAKILLQSISILKSKGHSQVFLVLYGLSENRVSSFVRQFALFYHRKTGNTLMKCCQIYVVSENYQAEVLFAGSQLRAISDYNQGRRLISGTSISISNMLDHIAQRQAPSLDNFGETLVPIPFDLLNRMEITPNSLFVSQHHKWYYTKLLTVLNNDIHGGDLGCCLRNVHVRTEKVHLHTFFEGQLLFANTYWYQIFSHYLCEQVKADPNISKNNTAILLYGYETYSEQMLFAAKTKLNDAGYDSSYALYENPKYITVEQTSDKRVRYIEDFLRHSSGKDICIVFVFGIGTTLATLEQRMYKDLLESIKDTALKAKLSRAYKKGVVIIQVTSNDTQQDISAGIICDQADHTVKSQQGHLRFLPNETCSYLVRVETELATANSCPYCFPDNYLDELPLIETNETSTIPMLLIKPYSSDGGNVCFKQEVTYTDLFLKTPNNAQYLYYTHLDRSGNHHQFYLRTASLLHDYLEKPDSEIFEWFKQIKSLECGNTEETSTPFKISIIVSPRHFSNESFVAAVNRFVFDGKAYIIDFDVKKEFRESFAAKFRNYRTALDMMGKQQKLVLNFYYVDDRIVTGATFNRAKSLITSMLGSFYNEQSSHICINLFKAIVVLVNRNSKNTLCNYFSESVLLDNDGNTILPVYRFIDLHTPSIRSYGDSCPLCSQMELIKTLRKESSLSFVENHWRQKAAQHMLMKLSSAKQHKEELDALHHDDPVYTHRGFRRLQCSEFVWELLKTERIDQNTAKEKLEARINQHLKTIDDYAMTVEYLISFLKVISREHIVYQEYINTAALQILLSIFSVFVGDNQVTTVGLYSTVNKLIHSKSLRSKNPEVLYELYQIVIARLCSMGSVILCREPQLEACLKTGFELEALCREKHGQSAKVCNESARRRDNPCFSEFLTIQMKKMLFATKDCDWRVERLAQDLNGRLKEFLEEDFDEAPDA